jgi:hypothetical protein
LPCNTLHDKLTSRKPTLAKPWQPWQAPNSETCTTTHLCNFHTISSSKIGSKNTKIHTPQSRFQCGFQKSCF